MKTLKYALLGQITLGPKTGYDLMQTFGSNYSHTWYASHSQIYPELKALTDEGLIQYETEIQGKVMEKKVYQVTDKGREEFDKWLLHDNALNSSMKDEFRLKLLYLSCMKKEDALRKVAVQKKKRMERMKKMSESLAQYGDSCPSAPDDMGNYLALKGSLMREESYLEWLDYCTAMITEKL